LTLPTDSGDFCGSKNITFTLYGAPTSIIWAKNKDYFNFYPALNSAAGTGIAQVVPILINYPDRVGNPITFKATILRPIVPVIANYTYVIAMSPLEIEYKQFKVVPADIPVGESSVKAYILRSHRA
jgi:hypothetical protein